ncbi:MAG: M1 family metallopeptidase [Calditrichia bacterium]
MKRMVWLLVIVGIQTIFSQNVVYPTNLMGVFEKGTRTMTGEAGTAYWQNSADYNIHVKIDTENKILLGEEKILYKNNSPDTLSYLVVRLYQNINKKGNGRDWSFGPENVNEGVIVENLVVDKDTIDLSNPPKRLRYTSTNLIIPLQSKLLPNNSVELQFKWKFDIPDSIRLRMGYYKSGAFFLAYWYPQIAVYDDLDGWDRNEYYGMVEFYNDFNNYSVNIEVPSDYYVWATGELQNEEEVYPTDVLDRINKARNSDEVVRILQSEDLIESRSESTKIWKFVANQVTDFSFALANNYLWDATSVMVDSVSGRRVLANNIYPPTTHLFDSLTPYVHKILDYFSNVLPGVPYPYPHITNFCNGQRGGGMETPMMTNDGDPANKKSAIGLLAHEIAHTYFPFFTGINERKYAWMDEGWATFLTTKFMVYLGNKSNPIPSLSRRYISRAGSEYDVPFFIPSAIIRSFALRFQAYTRSSMALGILENVLGEALFREATKEYIKRWTGKHPAPFDFFNTYEQISGQDLSWIWNTWYYGYGYPDAAMVKKKIKGKKVEVEIAKKGLFPAPGIVNILYADSTQEQIQIPITTWKDGRKKTKIKYKGKKDILDVWLEEKAVPDKYIENNRLSN